MPTDRPTRAAKLTDTAFVAAVVVLLLSVLSLAWRLHTATSAPPARKPEVPSAVTIGAQIPAFNGFDLAGKPLAVTFAAGDRPTVLYLFSPSCPACSRNLDNIKAIMSSNSAHFRFVGVSLSTLGLRDYLKENRLQFNDVVRDVPPQQMVQLQLRATPTTIVVSPAGRVMAAWVGAFSSRSTAEVGAFFHTHLPGLLPPSAID